MPIQLYSFDTPNGRKISVALEEMALQYTVRIVDIRKGQQHEADFLKISPNGKIPAIVDSDGPNGKPVSVFESGAILIYLGEKTGKFWPRDLEARIPVLEWLMFQHDPAVVRQSYRRLGHELGSLGWRWIAIDVLWAGIGGTAIGAVLGAAIGKLVVYLRVQHKEAVGLDEFLVLGLIGLSYGTALLCHAYGFLAVFAAGLALQRIRGQVERTAQPAIQPSQADDALATHPDHAGAYMTQQQAREQLLKETEDDVRHDMDTVERGTSALDAQLRPMNPPLWPRASAQASAPWLLWLPRQLSSSPRACGCRLAPRSKVQ